ncbi:FecR domain-containing protein [Novipirellula artificiosorum]|uniref:FecR protein n=1 Tax=Novipirellula artificiosorum TaxID=2528016 RepID=A0A5C6D8Q8_9BACT|nr:FecR domain-containing protein [Novipirellula artificiosorum]TWU32505.1 FecR protein [Novipirellula artificiosorum]
MTQEAFYRLLDALTTGDITAEEHAALQETLKEDPNARKAFRERMDLEAGLRTWATEPSPAASASGVFEHSGRGSQLKGWYVAALAIAVAIAFAVGVQVWINFNMPNTKQLANNQSDTKNGVSPNATRFVGFIRQQEDCQWTVDPVSTSAQFSIGKLSLSKGVAELSFDSGTDITIEGPCDIDVTSLCSARLLDGNVCVNVTELSNGFTLETPEAQIIDEGTEYAVSLDRDEAEVHVFDGSVIWIPKATESQSNQPAFEDRIEAGQARSYLRSEPTKASRITFGKRQFVRRLEEQVKEQAEGSLVAYDGFENLAGRVRRGRSGFGWSGGWQPSGRGRGKIGEVIDAPDDVIFGLNRSQRRMMLLDQDADICRNFEQTLGFPSGNPLYVSVLLQRQPEKSESDGKELSLQISLEPELTGRARRLHQFVSFGVTSDGFPFINSGNTVTKTASRVVVGETVLCVLKLVVDDQSIMPWLRVYHDDEDVDRTEPSAWTVTGREGSTKQSPSSLRIITGKDATWQIDELKIGTSWQSVNPEFE